MTTPGRRFARGFTPFASNDSLTQEPRAIGLAMAQGYSFARGLARFMANGVIWFELGMFAILRAIIMGMRWIGWFMRLEKERLDEDLRFLQGLGGLVILFISIKMCAAIYSKMGRFLQGLVGKRPPLKAP